MNLQDYAGVIHLHSQYSFDGRTPVPEILGAARANKIDFLLLTDHSTMQARTDGFEGWRDGVLLVVGEEIAPRFNHYLAFGHDRAVDCAEKEPDLPPQIYIDRVKAQGGFGFIAHPDHSGTPLFHVKHYPWQAWSVTGYSGIGIWDFMTDWQNSLSGYLRAILSYAFPAFFLCGPCPATLERWDSLTTEQAVVGIGELDNHDTRKHLWRFTISVFPFSRVFNLLRTHILTERPLTGNSQNDIREVLRSLKTGHCYVSLDYFYPARGFSMTINDGQSEATIGDRFLLQDTAQLQVSFPRPAKIRLIHNGRLIQETVGEELSYIVRNPGVYRIEAYLKAWGRYRPWVFANPLYVVAQ
ncbi:MAG: CehA/McbA family metallohydrolase [Syntrophales bacterium]